MRVKLVAGVMAVVAAWSSAAGVGAAVAQSDGAAVAGAERFENVKTYFDRARKLGFPAATAGAPYVLRAEFKTRGSSGEVLTGTYADTWVSDSQWRREAVFGRSLFVRSRDGKKRYRLMEGPDAELLQFVLTVMEPIPADESVRESDWRITREVVGGVATTRVAMGHENADGSPDARDFIAYWFDEAGQLVQSYVNGLETRRTDFRDFNGVKVARRVEVRLTNAVGMRIQVTELEPAGSVDAHIFTIKQHEWVRVSTAEER